jgi:hypothetical protein
MPTERRWTLTGAHPDDFDSIYVEGPPLSPGEEVVVAPVEEVERLREAVRTAIFHAGYAPSDSTVLEMLRALRFGIEEGRG